MLPYGSSILQKFIFLSGLLIIFGTVAINCEDKKDSVKISVEGIVSDAVDGSPVNNAIVRLSDITLLGGVGIKQVFTNMQGEYFLSEVVECFSDEKFIVSSDKGPRNSESKRIRCIEDVQIINFELQPADTLIIP